MNNQYMKKQDFERIVELCIPHLVKAGKIAENPTPEQQEWVTKLVALHQEKMSFGAEIVETY